MATGPVIEQDTVLWPNGSRSPITDAEYMPVIPPNVRPVKCDCRRWMLLPLDDVKRCACGAIWQLQTGLWAPGVESATTVQLRGGRRR